jgi:hypothetical protein
MRNNAKITSEPASHLDAHYSLVAPRRQRGNGSAGGETGRRIGVSAARDDSRVLQLLNSCNS